MFTRWGTDRNSMADTVLYYDEPQSLHVRDELPHPGIGKKKLSHRIHFGASVWFNPNCAGALL